MVKVLLYIWQLPQNILGFLLSRKPEFVSTGYGINIYYKKNISFLSYTLGNYTIMDYFYCGRCSKIHNLEKKYNKISKMLGPLYIFIIFIPQFFINIIVRFKTKEVFEMNNLLDKLYPNNIVSELKS